MSSASLSLSDSSSSPQRVKRKRGSEGSDDVETPETAPVPDDTVALSHAERRRQKKKDQKAQEQPSKKRKLTDSSVTDVSAKDSKPTGKAQPKRQNSVWVGNLWYKTTPDALRDFFDGVGEITRIHMPTKKGTKGEIMG
jgi:RNA recognition motif-containing protein